MNWIYCKVWNKVLGQLVVVLELVFFDSSGGVVDQCCDMILVMFVLLVVVLGLVLGLGMSSFVVVQLVQIGGSVICVVFSGKLLEKCLVEGFVSVKGSNVVVIGSNSSVIVVNSVVLGVGFRVICVNMVFVGDVGKEWQIINVVVGI